MLVVLVLLIVIVLSCDSGVMFVQLEFLFLL